MKPIIGVMPLWDDVKDSMWMLPGYLNGIIQAGGIPVIFPFSTEEKDLIQLINLCNGFLFTGGHDVSPKIYDEKILEGLVDCCEKRDFMEIIVLREAIIQDKPVLGICRGIQFINAILGGTLYQDIPTQYSSGINHHQLPPYDIPIHTVNIVSGSPLHKCLGVEQLPVNSYHHQAVRVIAPELKVMAKSTDGIIEALYKPDHRFLWAVQWHPEFSYKTDENSMKIFRAFVNSMIFNDEY